jgi:hypothetical protein
VSTAAERKEPRQTRFPHLTNCRHLINTWLVQAPAGTALLQRCSAKPPSSNFGVERRLSEEIRSRSGQSPASIGRARPTGRGERETGAIRYRLMR